MLRNAGNEGLSRQPNAITTGWNSGYQAVGIAIAAGASRIVLLGYDMQHTGGRTHWHGGHPLPSPEDWYLNLYTKAFREMKPPPTVEIINCSRVTRLKCFKQMPLEEALA